LLFLPISSLDALVCLPRRSLGEGGSLLTDSLRQIQHGDFDLVDVAHSVARAVLLQELFVAQLFFDRLVGKVRTVIVGGAAGAGSEYAELPVQPNTH